MSEYDELAEDIFSPEKVIHEFEDCSDIQHIILDDVGVELLYFDYLVDQITFQQRVMQPITNVESDKERLHAIFKRSFYTPCLDVKEGVKAVLAGQVAIFFEGKLFLADAFGPEMRGIEQSETETTIIGSHESFNESIFTSMSLIRRRLKSSHLKVLRLSAGEITKTDIFILYIEDIANFQMVEELKKRVEDVEVDFISDSNMFVQMIDDFPYSMFPQFLTTERPEVCSYHLTSGKIVGLVDGSPSAFIGPINFFEFFQSPDDVSQRWALGTATMILRHIAFFITLAMTAFYVSVTTFHYEMVPEDLLINLAESRNQVPFPPLIEALIMEFTIELLREAGARLPAKIGQTIGIVGGIVIGQAAVDAGLVSNTLIIAVATSAIASFVLPNYLISAGLRIARFVLIILAGTLGNLGLTIGIAVLFAHLCKLTNLGVSYMSPIAPFHLADWKQSVIRAPLSKIKKRPHESKSENVIRNKMKN
ncbi:spore germination protein [Evansella halocellulosilytica]|uniref:spore germination protein n=1 Tax=Evansella halocellulosilytica TaxID=2011013 RepID=UPI00211CB30B|nr:spore germination protein [Evansella halocellulosilytica]